MTTDQEPTSAGLSELHMKVLDFAATRWKYSGAQETAIRERFGFGATRYFQILNHVLDLPEAVAHSPQLVNRLRRVRDARRAKRSARRRGFDL